MVISHNMLAMNANRMFGINANAKAKSTEKLSSGYKINRSADDAAGLAISEKMRRQIRGLMQGSENIVEGINLVQTAEGALDEITDMIHRMKELSVKALNDTNSREDREYIQQEINQLVSEIDRTSDTTTYNELPLLKGNLWVKVERTETQNVTDTLNYDALSMPTWLTSKSSNELTLGTISGTQKMDGYALHAVMDANGKIDPTQSYYYGPKPADVDELLYNTYKWKAEWTPDLSDNYSGKIDFSGLTDFKNAEDLYCAILDLGGTSYNIPCGTCDKKYMGVAYYVNLPNYIARPEGAMNSSGHIISNSGTLSLNKYLKMAEDLSKKHHENNALTDAEKETQTANLAKDIAKQLRDESFAIMLKDDKHFDLATMEGDYAIGVYDYRDAGFLTNKKNFSINFDTNCSITLISQKTEEVLKEEMTRPNMLIACSSLVPDGDYIDFELPNVSSGTLGLWNYQISNYETEQKYTYTKEFAKKLDEYKDAMTKYQSDLDIYYDTFVLVDEIRQETRYPETPIFKNGEFKGVEVDRDHPIKKSIVVQVPKYTGVKPTLPTRPVPTSSDIIGQESYTEYKPSNMNILDDALDKILKMRADLGAVQNRLEHAYNNNRNKEENLTAAESQIRDTDMAREMVKFSNLNVLSQAGQSVLAQANQSKQGILTLLQ